MYKYQSFWLLLNVQFQTKTKLVDKEEGGKRESGKREVEESTLIINIPERKKLKFNHFFM